MAKTGIPAPRAPAELTTERLRLRPLHAEDDLSTLAAINADPQVTRYLGGRSGPETAAPFLAMAGAHWRVHGYGYWGIEFREGPRAGELVGFAGLGHPVLAEILGRVELGWRLSHEVWGQGIATEAATTIRDTTWSCLPLRELISLIHPENARSQRVAEKLGMVLDGHAFHPAVGITVQVWRLQAPAGRATAG